MDHDQIEEHRKIEYEQISEDWRYRDAQIWKSLGITVAITGGAAALLFGKDLNLNNFLKIIILASVILHNLLILTKLSKDRFYQFGSRELLFKLGKKDFVTINKINTDKEEPVLLRLYKPTTGDHSSALGLFKCLYNKLLRFSSYKFIYWVHIAFVVTPLMLLCLTIFVPEWLTPTQHPVQVDISSLKDPNNILKNSLSELASRIDRLENILKQGSGSADMRMKNFEQNTAIIKSGFDNIAREIANLKGHDSNSNRKPESAIKNKSR